jgi:hydrogenase-4 component B
MQYTGASFSAQFAAIFYAVLPQLRREALPRGPFPERNGRLDTHCPDAVEKRMFEVIGDGDRLVTRLADRAPAEPRVSLAAGLVVLVVAVGLLIASAGGLR